MAHELPKLGYSYDALEPYIDAKTMEVHYTKHHQAYIDKLNAALKDYPKLEGVSAEQLMLEFKNVPDEIKNAVKNHGGGHANHSFFWPLLKKSNPENNKPKGEIAEEIKKKFGSFEKFKEAFSAAATSRFGSGWAWLVVDKEGALEIIDTPNQDSPLMQGLTPILGIDVWEHAYYLTYQNRRAEYVENFFKIINWEKVEENFRNASD